MEQEQTSTTKANDLLQIIIQLLTIILLAVMSFYFYKVQNQISELMAHVAEHKVEISQSAISTRREFDGEIDIEDTPVYNDPKTANVVVIEFSDFECPYCAKASTKVRQLQQENPDILFVHKDFPLKYHTRAEAAAVAAHCAWEQEKFWDFYQQIFTDQNFSEEAYLDYAQMFGLETELFKSCLNDPTQTERVQSDFDLGLSLKVDKVPLFIMGSFSQNANILKVQGEYYTADELEGALSTYVNR